MAFGSHYDRVTENKLRSNLFVKINQLNFLKPSMKGLESWAKNKEPGDCKLFPGS